MNESYPVTKFEIYVANWALKIAGLLFGFFIVVALFGPGIGFFLVSTEWLDVASATAGFIASFILGGWWFLWIKVGETPQGRVIFRLIHVVHAMLLHSERHRYFFGWDFEKPITEQIHTWHG